MRHGQTKYADLETQLTPFPMQIVIKAFVNVILAITHQKKKISAFLCRQQMTLMNQLSVVLLSLTVQATSLRLVKTKI